MATGFEIAGLVLAVIPIVFDLVEHHKKGLTPLKRFFKHHSLQQELADEIECQRVLFQDCCSFLLSIVDPPNRRELAENGHHPDWQAQELDDRLSAVLDYAYVIYKKRISTILALFTGLERELAPDRKSSDWFPVPQVMEEQLSRIRFSFSGTSQAHQLQELRRHLAWLKEVLEGAKVRKTSGQHQHAAIARLKADRNIRKSIYRCIAQSWGCRCSRNHAFNLRLTLDADPEALTAVFTVNCAVASSDCENPASWPWYWQPAKIRTSQRTGHSGAPAKSHKPTHGSANVGTQSASIIARLRQSSSKVVEEPLESLRLCNEAAPASSRPSCQDLCHRLRQSVLNEEVSLGVMYDSIDEQPLQHHVYQLQAPTSARDLLSLDAALSHQHDPHQFGKMNARDRVELGTMLVNAVLQHHKSPFLQESWGSQNVLLVKAVGGTCWQSTTEPYLQAGFHGPNSPESAAKLPFVRNMTLFNLGIVLMEIALNNSILNLMTDNERAQATAPGGAAGFALMLAANRLLPEVPRHLPSPGYYEATCRCLRGDFGDVPILAEDLENDDLLRGVYSTTAKPLMDDLKRLPSQPTWP